MTRREQFLDALGLMPEWRLRRMDAMEPAYLPEVAVEPVEDSAPIDATVAKAIGTIETIETTGIAAPPAMESASRAERIAVLDWEALERDVSACRSCKLCEQRTQTVFGVGDHHAEWMLIGEGPGETEDKEGLPFVGQSGKLLDNMLRALGMSRTENVFIANAVKCRPPNNRNPEPEEMAQCEPYLKRQVALLRPKLIVVLGGIAAHSLLQTDTPVGKLRGQVHHYEGIPVVVTYHPSYLLRSLNEKAKAWDDLCFARSVYERSRAATGPA